MEKTKGKARPLHLPLHTAVSTHTCQVRTQHELMRMEFQFKVFIRARCMRGVGPLLTGTPLRIVSLYPPRTGGEERPYEHLSCFLVGHRGAELATVYYTALLFTNTRRKHSPHVCRHT